jgi:hypothetical protein
MTVKLVQGKVEQISIKPIASGPDRFDNTHRKSAKVDGVWYSFGGAKSAKWNVKDGAEFKELGVGSEIAFKAEQSGDFWNAKSLMPINIVPPSASQGGGQQVGQASGGTQGSYTPKPKFDQTGVQVGHSFNGAMNFLLTQGVEPSNENIVKYAKSVHNVTEKVKKATEAKNAGMDAYSVGAMSGNAILNACKLIDPNGDFEEQLEALATDFLDNVVPKIAAHVKGEEKPVAAVKVSRAAPAKKSATKAAPVQQEELEEDESSDQLPF